MMQFVTSGGRLDPPGSHSPSIINDLMKWCWNSSPDLRPSFSAIIDRLAKALMDPVVLQTPLPTFARVPAENDTLRTSVPISADYLAPSHPRSNSASNYTCSTATNDDCHLLELLDDCNTSLSVPAKKTGGEMTESPYKSHPASRTENHTPSSLQSSKRGSPLDHYKVISSPSPSSSSSGNVAASTCLSQASSSTPGPLLKRYVNV